LSFNQTLGYLGKDPLTPEILKSLAFYRKNRELFIGTKDLAAAAVLRSFPSITYHNSRAQLSAILVEQSLIQSRIPFALIFDEHLSELSKYKALILPEAECLSDGQLAAIRRFVENGGGLVAVGQSGMYDEWRRRRTEPGLRGLLDAQAPAREYEETVEVSRLAAGPAVRKEAGKGRTVYVPSVDFDGPLPPNGTLFCHQQPVLETPQELGGDRRSNALGGEERLSGVCERARIPGGKRR
jgi:hypothetical protein